MFQVCPNVPIEDIAKILPSFPQLKSDLKQLLSDADPSDITHDVLFHVKSRQFAAHRFVLATNCYTFYRDVCLSSSSFQADNKTVTILDIPAEIFQLCLEFMYTGTCPLFETDPAKWNLFIPAEVQVENSLTEKTKIVSGKKERRKSEHENETLRIICMTQFYAKKLSIYKLAEMLEKV